MDSTTIRALVVDDEGMIRRLTSVALGCHGIVCDAASSGSEALKLLQGKHYDLVVTDLRMPNGHGHSLCAAILKKDERPRIVVLTGMLEPRLVNDLKARGVDGIFFKPVDFDTFGADLHRLVLRRRGTGNGEAAPAPNLGLKAAMPTAGGERPADGRLRSVASGSAAKPAHDSLPRSTQDSSQPSTQSHFAAILRKRADQSCSLADRLRQLGIDTVAVDSADALFRLLEERRTDLYVVDNQLEGLFSGQEIIGKLRKQWSQIPAVLINRGDEALADVARAMGGVTILDSAANVDEIAETALRIVKHQGDDQELIPERARALVENQGDLPVMPQLVLRLMTYLGMPGEAIPLMEMCREISVDPKASLVVLKAANASINGLSRNIVNVPDAIRLLGVQRAVGHILMAAMTDGMGDLSKGLTTEQRTWHGRRGMLIASTSSHFAEQLEHRSGETALLLGILQDIGMPILLRAHPKEYGAVLHRWREIGHLKLASIEQSELGCTHADVSAALLKRWNMPSALVRPVLHHLQPTADAAKAGVDTGLHRVMMIAEALADSIDAPHANRRSALDRMLASYGLPQKKAACLSLQNAVAKAAEAFQLMSVPLPSAQELESMVRSALSESLPNIKESTGTSVGSQAALRAGTSKR